MEALSPDMSAGITYRNVAIIINPISCSPSVDELKRQITELLYAEGRSLHFLETTESADARSLAGQALAGGADLIIAAGGDGTIMESINGMVRSPVPLGVIPLGTGNLLAINLGIPISVSGAVTTILSGKTRLIDLIEMGHEDLRFAIMGGIGFDAKIMHDTDRSSKQMFGKLAYFWTALQNLSADTFKASVTLGDTAPFECEATGILVGNMGLIAPNVAVFPDADPEDGLLEIGILKAASPVEFARLLATAVTEGHPERDIAFDIHRAFRAVIELVTPQPLEIDGDKHGETSTFQVEVVPQAIRIICPAE